MKIGIVIITRGGSIFSPRGWGDFFESLDVDWRLVLYPFTLFGSEVARIHRENFGKSLCYGRYSERYKDVAWEKFGLWGHPVINPQEVDEDSWNESRDKHYRSGWSRDCIDFHEIRILHEEIGKYSKLSKVEKATSVAKNVQLIEEWVGGCDQLFIDITDSVSPEPDRAWEAINNVLEVLKNLRKTIFFYDYIPVSKFSRSVDRDNRNNWNAKIIELSSRYQIYIEDLGNIERIAGTTEKEGVAQYIGRMNNAYNETLKECILSEINRTIS